MHTWHQDDDQEAGVLPAEDPYVRLLREREREWRGTTIRKFVCV